MQAPPSYSSTFESSSRSTSVNSNGAISKFISSTEKPLREILLTSYLLPTANWLIGPQSSAYLLPQVANSNWECALSIEYLLNIDSELADTTELKTRIKPKVIQTTRWIASQAEHLDTTEMAHWEGVTWDTAVCIRSIFAVLQQFPDSFADKEKDDLMALIKRGIKWLIYRFEKWEVEVMYPFGPPDIAQVLRTLLFINKRDPTIVEPIAKLFYGDNGLNDGIEKIATFLVAAVQDIPRAVDNTAEATAFWGDFFATGEVIDCLAFYLGECESGNLKPSDTAIVENCFELVTKCIRYMETHQVDGRWGTHLDTCRALHAYIRSSRAITGAGVEDHVVLKALRWMCDEKQTFVDGSFMHTTFITVFYALSLWEVYKVWPLCAFPMSQVYDIALWSAPVRSTPERALRLGLQIQNQRLEKEIQQLQRQKQKEDNDRQHKRLLRRKFLFATLGIVMIVCASILIALASNLLGIYSGSIFTVPDRNTFVAYVALTCFLAVTVASVLISWQNHNHNEVRSPE